MAYNYFPTGYQPMQYYPNQNQQSNSSLIWVQGEAGAKSYLVAPNQTVQLWDSEANVIYLKSADASGMPSIRVLDYTIRDNAPARAEVGSQTNNATKEEVANLEAKLNALRAELEKEHTDVKSDI